LEFYVLAYAYGAVGYFFEISPLVLYSAMFGLVETVATVGAIIVTGLFRR